MQQAKLEVQLREASGKGAARATRRAGLVPAIVYGHKVAPAPVQLPERSLRNFMSSGGENVIIHMHLGEDEVETVMLKDIQIDPVSRRIVHADFIRVSLEEVVAAHVPIILIGEPPGISEGGIQEFLLREFQIECQVGQMPENIEVDVSSLEIGDRIRVSDIQLPEEMTLLDDPATIIITVVPPSIIEVEEEEEEELEEGEEGEISEDEDQEPEVIGEKGRGDDEEEEE